MAGYPQPLKDKLNPALPRNGALVADVTPPVVAWAVTRKGRGSARRQNLKNGIFIYNLPKLIDELVYNMAYQAGLPHVGLGIMPVRITAMSAPPMAMSSTVASMGAGMGTGRYVLKNSAPVVSVGSGMGRYR